jgi:apoptosis-inducing factor 2
MALKNLKNIIVVGGSYVGLRSAEYLGAAMHETHRVILVEKNSHFQVLLCPLST